MTGVHILSSGRETRLMTQTLVSKKRPRSPVADDGWRIPDALWQRLEPLLPPASRTRWAATTRVCLTAGPWTPSSSCCAAAASGARSRPRASAPRVLLTVASRIGQRLFFQGLEKGKAPLRGRRGAIVRDTAGRQGEVRGDSGRGSRTGGRSSLPARCFRQLGSRRGMRLPGCISLLHSRCQSPRIASFFPAIKHAGHLLRTTCVEKKTCRRSPA
jgi:hypothetical protein